MTTTSDEALRLTKALEMFMAAYRFMHARPSTGGVRLNAPFRAEVAELNSAALDAAARIEALSGVEGELHATVRKFNCDTAEQFWARIGTLRERAEKAEDETRVFMTSSASLTDEVLALRAQLDAMTKRAENAEADLYNANWYST